MNEAQTVYSSKLSFSLDHFDAVLTSVDFYGLIRKYRTLQTKSDVAVREGFSVSNRCSMSKFRMEHRAE